MSIWESRIVAHDRIPPEQLVPHPLNHRKHPQKQRDVLSASIREIGFVRSVTVNQVTGHIIDGHDRVLQAIEDNQPLIDVEYVKLSKAEEKKALAYMDRISEMAEIDPQNLGSLLKEIDTEEIALRNLLEEMALEAGLLEEEETELKQLDVKPPPAMTWVLIGIPTVRFGEISETVERLAAIPETIIESTSNDG